MPCPKEGPPRQRDQTTIRLLADFASLRPETGYNRARVTPGAGGARPGALILIAERFHEATGIGRIVKLGAVGDVTAENAQRT
jgi:hypothetical protein